jgi:histidinol-phosphate aminotransferase
LEHKVVIRPFSGDGVRITIGDPNENEMALAAAREWQNSDPQGRQPPI